MVEKTYLHKELTYNIIGAANFVANGYGFYNLVMDSGDLHTKYKKDLVCLLNERGFPSVAEEYYIKPKGRNLVRDEKEAHFIDIEVDKKVLVELKVGSAEYLYGKQSVASFQGQCLNTVEYSPYRVILLLRLLNDEKAYDSKGKLVGRFNVDPTRFEDFKKTPL